MRVYISGNTELKDNRSKFDQAEIYLRKQKHEAINPFKISTESLAPWEIRLKRLENCEAIFLLSDWQSSRESQFEKSYSELTKKTIMYQSSIEDEIQRNTKEQLIISNITGTIKEVTGMSFDQYIKEDRKPEGYFCRMIFSIQCQKAGIDEYSIVKYIPRDRCTILYYWKKYRNEYKFNKSFRQMADNVNTRLYPETKTVKV